MNVQKNYLLLLSFLLAGCATPTPPFDVKETTKTVYTLKNTLEQAAEFLPLVNTGTDASCQKELEVAAKELLMTSDRASATLATLKQQFLTPYQTFCSVSDYGVLIAVRHRPFLDETPVNVKVQMTDGACVITKTGGTESYHASIDHKLNEGACFAVRFRLPTRGAAGGTPIPYFGVRDGQGQEEVLVLFSSYPKPDDVHEILLFRKADIFAALHDGQIKTVRARGTVGPIYPFFHMNDQSSVAIVEVRLPSQNEKAEAANKVPEDTARKLADPQH